MNHITENEFITGIADGTYTPNDAVAYCQQCFDKVGFLDRLYVYSFLECNYNDRERDLIRKAKDVVYCYLLKEGYKLSHYYECYDCESNEIGTKRGGIVLPPELDTDRARVYFARALELGYMERTATGYKWLFGGNRGLARLGYFVLKIYCPTNTEQLPESAINNLFGVNRIASAITQLHNAKKPQGWRAEIDSLFDN